MSKQPHIYKYSDRIVADFLLVLFKYLLELLEFIKVRRLLGPGHLSNSVRVGHSEEA